MECANSDERGSSAKSSDELSFQDDYIDDEWQQLY